MLNKRIKTTGMEITPAISEYVHKKIDALERFIESESVALAEVEIGRTTNHHHKGDVYKAEINFTLEKDIFRAVAIQSDLYVAIDVMKDNIMQEVTKAKKKRFALFRKGQQKIKDAMRKIRE